MHDFRPKKQAKKSSNGFLAHNMKEESENAYSNPYQNTMMQVSTKQARGGSVTQLDPILENEGAQAVQLKHLYLPKSMA